MTKSSDPKAPSAAPAEQRLMEALHEGLTSAETLTVSPDGERREIAFEIRIVVEGGRILETSVSEIDDVREAEPAVRWAFH